METNHGTVNTGDTNVTHQGSGDVNVVGNVAKLVIATGQGKGDQPEDPDASPDRPGKSRQGRLLLGAATLLALLLVVLGIWGVREIKAARKAQEATTTAPPHPSPAKPPADADQGGTTGRAEPEEDEAGHGSHEAGYVLKESNNPLTAAKDKLDIDTGLPGRGSQPQIRQNAGGLADIILEPERLHTPDDRPRLLLTSKLPPDPAACEREVSRHPGELRGSIPNEELDKGAVLCVRTDLGLTAAVEVRDFSADYPATLSIVVRTPSD